MSEDFEVIGAIEEIQPIARGSRIREIARLRKALGAGRWRKLKGIARVRFEDGTIHRVELHWYEAHATTPAGLPGRGPRVSGERN